MIEVFTVGGGEYLVNVFNAVASWAGSGGYRGLIRVVMVMAFTWALLVTAWNMDPRALLKWFMQATLMYMVVMVPTISVKVTDRTNPGVTAAVVDNVPVGLGLIAGFTSQIGDYLTRAAETVFAMPQVLNYSTGGMIYGAKLLDATQGLRIDDPVYATNLNEHFKQCVFYDILLGRKTYDDILKSSDLLTAMGPGSVALSQQYIYPDGTSGIITCQTAYSFISAGWNSYYAVAAPKIAAQFFPGIPAAQATARLNNDMNGMGAAGMASSSGQLVRQAMFINALSEARDGFASGSAQGAIDAFAQTRADIQTRNTYSTIAGGAMKWVPLLNIVLTVVFYSLFPILFLLMLLPTNGMTVAKGYITGFFYLAAWGPLFVILNMIFMSRWQDSLASWGANGGLTAANFSGISALNQDVGALAGYMIMSVPFIAAGMAKGAMAIASHSASFLSPSQNAAEQAAAEATTGNYAYGNASLMNRQINTLNRDQYSTAPSFNTGAGTIQQRSSDGAFTRYNEDGTFAYDTSQGISNLGFGISANKDFGSQLQKGLSQGSSVVDQKRVAANDSWAATRTESARLFDTAQTSASATTEEGRSLQSSIAQVQDLSSSWSNTLQTQFGMTKSEADRLARDTVLTGSAGIDGSGTLSGGGGPLSAQASLRGGVNGKSSDTRNTEQGVSSQTSNTDALQWLERESSSEAARQARESFYRATTSSTDSQVRGLGQEVSQDLRHSQSLSNEASRAEDQYQRWSNEFSQFERDGYALNKNLSQDFVRYAQTAMMDPQNRHLDQSYHPGLINMTPTQAITQDALVKQFMDDRVEQMHRDLGVVPDAPAATISGPSFSTADEVRAIGAAGMQEIAARGPSVDVSGSARDVGLEDNVSGRLDGSAARLEDYNQGMRATLLGDRRQAESLGATAEARNDAWVTRTMPFVAGALKAIGLDGAAEAPLGGHRVNLGGVASAAGLDIKSGANLSSMDSSMAPALTAAAASAHALGLPQRVVTSARDSQHTRGSLHPEGKGLDLRGNDISVTKGRQWASDVRERLGPDYDVNFETFRDNPANNHLHIEHDPKPRGGRGRKR
ncbi:conjugal transfer protein TraG N-terminal domain-containing protein [Sphingopyxis sp. R3-92]|uniref:conjugal transfer protein TraG N-terminal domain-containing protein n=1 Tax=Sphingopyxis sp. R3-92 TaxID=3158553 RepID=UPI003EE45EF9